MSSVNNGCFFTEVLVSCRKPDEIKGESTRVEIKTASRIIPEWLSHLPTGKYQKRKGQEETLFLSENLLDTKFLHILWWKWDKAFKSGPSKICCL